MADCEACGRPLPDPDGVVFDPEALSVSRAGIVVRIAKSEAAILALLHARRGRPVSHEAIFDALWGRRPDCDWPESNALIVHVSKLRTALAQMGLRIVNYRGCGYALAAAEGAP